MPITQRHRAAQLTTPLGEDVLLFRSLNAFERLSQPFEYRITALATDGSVDLDGLLGEKCSVTLTMADGRKRYFHGKCAQISFAGNEHGGLLYELTLRPDLWFLSRNRNCRIFQKRSTNEIVSDVLQDNGITRFQMAIKGDFPPQRTFCVQYMESDFAFISRLMEHEGFHYFFRQDESGYELIIADSNEAHDTVEGFDSVPYYPPGGLYDRQRSFLNEWSPVHSVSAPVSLRATDFFHMHPRPMKQSNSAPPSYGDDKADMQLHPAGYETQEYGAKLARARLDAERALRAHAVGSGTALGLRPGSYFEMNNHPHSAQNRQHLVVEARLHIAADTYTAGGAGMGGHARDHIDILTIPADTKFRPLLQTPRPRILGTQTAIVRGAAGEEIHTEQLGSVKVAFHWDTYSMNDQTSSCWVRVGQSWAGAKWGGLFTPRIGMEVLVEFIDGDPDRPIIVGAVYNGQNEPPYGLPGDKTKSTIKSNSSLGGGGFNEIRFEDKKGSEEIYIHAQKDQNVEILNNLSTTVGNTEHRTVGSSRTTSIGTNETKTVGGNESKTVSMSETLTVALSQSETVGAARTTTIAATDTLTVGAARTTSIALGDMTTVGAAATLSVGGAYSVSVGGAMNLVVGGAMNLQVGGLLNINAGGAVNIMAPMINIMGGVVNIKGKAISVG
ncbi:MAG: type VI secretion system tip protein TssI/VgrG [Micropepsaceae bacterium]